MEQEKLSQFCYAGLNNLSGDLDYFLKTSVITHVNVVAYKINTGNQTPTPFLTFLLFKNTQDVMNIPIIYLRQNYNEPSSRVSQYLQKELINLMNSQNYNRASCEGIVYNGFFVSNNEVYVFYDISHIEWTPYDSLVKRDHLWLALVDEIVNTGAICNMQIDPKLTIFFLEHPFFGFLEDNKGNEVEAPIVAYRGKRAQELNFTFVFGVSTSDKNSMFGPYYYFTDYCNAIKQGGCSEPSDDPLGEVVNISKTKKPNKGGIIRFAVFMNKTMIIDNSLDIETDQSSTKQARITDASLNTTYENLTIRISDHDGTWATKYDSVFVGKVLLDNGQPFNGSPIFVVKTYEQQHSLSYHLIDHKSLNDQLERKNNYYIM